MINQVFVVILDCYEIFQIARNNRGSISYNHSKIMSPNLGNANPNDSMNNPV